MTTMTTGQRRPPSTQPHRREHLLAGWEWVQLTGMTTKRQRNDDETTKNDGETEKPAHPTAASPCLQGGDSEASERHHEGTTTEQCQRRRTQHPHPPLRATAHRVDRGCYRRREPADEDQKTGKEGTTTSGWHKQHQNREDEGTTMARA